MTARYLNIEAHIRESGGIVVSLKDFTVSDGDAVDAGIVLSNPDVSLMCFDDDNKRAIFAELPPDINLTKEPFIYLTHYELAVRLIAVPYDTFRALAHTLQPVAHLIMMYIGGRSGSTLLHHVFNELDDVMSLSEPDIITQFIHIRPDDHSRDAELRELFDCTVRMLFKPNPYKTPKIYALKYRSETLRAMDLFHTTFPFTKNLFLYREAEGFVRSFYRIFSNLESTASQPISTAMEASKAFFSYDATHTRGYLDPESEQISIVQWMTWWWILVMDWYLEQAARDIPILAVRYADLNAQREQALTAIFDYCGLPVEQVAKGLAAFDRDSQAGTWLGRENPTEGNKLQLTATELAEMTRILARHPIIKESDFIAPYTLKV